MKTAWYVGWVLFGLALLFTGTGCSGLYAARVQSFPLLPPRIDSRAVSGPVVASPVTVTTVEQWTSMFSAICGAVVTDTDGKVLSIIPGNCGTPLTLLLGSPVNIGLASTAAAMIH